MSIETVLEEISALRNDIKTLSKIVRKVKAKQDDPNGERQLSVLKITGLIVSRWFLKSFVHFWNCQKVNWSREVLWRARLISTSTKRVWSIRITAAFWFLTISCVICFSHQLTPKLLSWIYKNTWVRITVNQNKRLKKYIHIITKPC